MQQDSAPHLIQICPSLACRIEGETDTQIAELRSMLDGGPTKPTVTTTEAPTVKHRKFSAAARRRMKEAQQLRWAKIRGESQVWGSTT